MKDPAAMKRILVPLDLSAASKALLEYVGPLARGLGAEVELLFVWEPPQFVAPELTVATAAWTTGDLQGQALKQSQRELDELIQSPALAGVRTRAVVEVGGAAEGIVRVAERERVDLIVIGTHGRHGLERFLLGSVAQRVVGTAPCPVLTVNLYAKPSMLPPSPPRKG